MGIEDKIRNCNRCEHWKPIKFAGECIHEMPIWFWENMDWKEDCVPWRVRGDHPADDCDCFQEKKVQDVAD